MFGLVIANPDKLSQEEELRYRSCYCGLCTALGKRHGTVSRITLTYDMTFLILLLSALYEKDSRIETERCIIHPIKRHKYWQNEFTDYAADMNVALAYYNFLDDWNDSRKIIAKFEAKLFERKYRRIAEQYPIQCKMVKECLDELSGMEKACVTNPDIPSNCFGRLLGGIFALNEDEYSDGLRAFGNSLGRFIYIMDACLDLKEDIKSERYNPMATTPSEDFDSILNVLMADCMEKYRQLPVKQDGKLLENILYSGIWIRYEAKKLKTKEKHKK
ncbi:MAG: DUF5685 family protein [Clostridiaceae bacterium]